MHPSAAAAWSLLLLLCGGLSLAIIGLTLYTMRVLTHPYRRTYASALARSQPGEPSELRGETGGPRPYTSWDFDVGGTRLPGWDCPGDNPHGPTIILCHGWGDSRIGGLSRLAVLAPTAARLILWDMPGHGDAPGTCALGTREVAALFALIERIGGPVVLYGWSLGAGVSIAAAAVSPDVRAVVAEAPYRQPWTPARNVLRAFGLPWRINLPLAMAALGVMFRVEPRWRGFDRAQIAASLTCPILVLHGSEDDICPPQDGRDIAGAAPHGTFALIPGAGHHGLWSDAATAATCMGHVAAFLGHSDQTT